MGTKWEYTGESGTRQQCGQKIICDSALTFSAGLRLYQQDQPPEPLTMRQFITALLVVSLLSAAVAVRVVPVLLADECTADNLEACE